MIIRENVPLSELTTMRLGGPAKYVIDIEKIDDIASSYAFADEKHLPVYVLGGGANTIGKDEGFAGVIIRNAMTGIEVSDQNTFSEERVTALEGDPQLSFAKMGEDKGRQDPLRSEKVFEHLTTITAMGGTEWDAVVAYTTERGLTGIEALSKIPGLACAAPVQNIGAYGQELADTFVSAEVYDTTDGQIKTLTKSDFGFSYRRSILNSSQKGRYFVISITLALKSGQMSRPFYNSIEKYITEHQCTDFSPKGIRNIVSIIRADKLPDPAEKASAGSFFKNIYLAPEEVEAAEAKDIPVYHGHDGLKVNSGWLIEQCGLKGQLLHGIRVCDKAALVLINESATGYSDLAAARTEIIKAVHDKFGYTLEQEPNEI